MSLIVAHLVSWFVWIFDPGFGAGMGAVVTVAAMAIPWGKKPDNLLITLAGAFSALLMVVINKGPSQVSLLKAANPLLFLFLLGVTILAAGSRHTWQTLALRLPQSWAPIIVTIMAGFLSGILDGVSVIGMTLATLTILRPGLLTAMVASIATSVGGFWAAWGEPPNLIMKMGLGLDNRFFLTWLGIPALVTTMSLAWHMRHSTQQHAQGEKVVGKTLAPIGVFLVGLILHGFWAMFPVWLAPWLGVLVGTAIHAYDRKNIKAGYEEWKAYIFLAPFFIQAACVRQLGALDWMIDLIPSIALAPTAGILMTFLITVILGALLDSSSVAQILVLSLQGVALSGSLREAVIAAGLSGFAIGGALTPIGSMQSAVTYEFLRERGETPSWGTWFKLNLKLVVIPTIATLGWIYYRLR